MEKQKILEWLDRLTAIKEAEIKARFFDPKKKYGSLMTCAGADKEIQLFESVRKICNVCGFAMEREIRQGAKAPVLLISFRYRGYKFYEWCGEIHV